MHSTTFTLVCECSNFVQQWTAAPFQPVAVYVCVCNLSGLLAMTKQWVLYGNAGAAETVTRVWHAT